MSKISTYEVAPVPKLSDKLIGTSVGGEIEDITYNFTLLELLELFLPVIPANNLQGVLDYGNTATQDINLFGTITTTNLEVTDTANLFITYLNEETHIVGSLFDSADSIGTAGQVLTSTGEGVEWFTLPPIFTPNLQQVLEEGNTADLDIILDADLEAINITADTANIATQLSIQGVVVDYNESAGTAGQVLESTSTGVQWVNLPVYSATSPLLFDSGTNTFSIQVANSTQGGYLTANDWVTFDGKQNAGAYITALTGEATATGPGSVPITLNNASVIAKVLTGLNITGGSISATDSILTAFGKVQNQINGLMGGVQYQGVWNAATNTPTLTSSVGTQGHYYIVNVAGTTNLNGITDWQVGDWAIFSGGAWQKVDNTDSVTSVNGQTGAVSLTTDNIPEGTTNLYFLDSRARAAVSATSPLSYNNTTGVFSIQQASGTQNGYLSSTDWTTFNNKQNYLSGTGLVKSTAGTITYITDNSSNWNTAYNRSIISAAVTGTGTKTLTLNEQDGNTITASWSDADTGLTSVGLTMPSAFIVANSPLTSNGTIGVTGAGTTAEYIRGDGSLATFPSIISEAQNLVTEVYNSSGATLTKGTVVYINGGQGNLPTITKAIATGDPTSAQTYGVVRSDITNMNNGYVVVTGRLGDLDTRDYTPGQQLYLSSTTAGAWTPTKQYAPAHLVYVGIVVRAHPTQGVVEILIQNGFEMDELHNVAAQNPDNNDILQFKTSTNLWTKVAGTTTNIAEGTNLYYLDSRARAALSFTPGSGAYNSTTGVITIPTNTNQLTNGAAFITLGSLSALAPLSYNNTTGAFSISQAGASTDGYLSSTDWNTFNNKQPAGSYVPTSRQLTINGTQYDLSADRSWSVGTVTSVAALTLGTSGTDLSSTVATATTTPVITLNVPTASAANRGALSAADWSTFNTKVGSVTASSPLASSGGSTPNLTIQQASGSQDGYLSSTDWTTFNNKQAAGNYITSLTGEATASGPGAASVTLNNASVTAKVLTGVNITGGSISATDSILTAFGKVQNQINGLVGGSIYQGTWNASTNTPALASGVGTKGYYYIVSVAGTTNLDGITDWFVGDWAIFDGTAWQQVDNTDAVVSVNGQTGAVSLTTDNIPEGSTNQYYLNSRARAALSFTAGSGAYNSTTGVITIPTNTSQLTNGANFITLASLSGTAPIQYSNTTGAISITQSSTASNGYLSSTDWNTFNNKANALSGTTNYVSKFTGTSTIGNSSIFDTGTFVGINSTTNVSSDFRLQVSGGIYTTSSAANTVLDITNTNTTDGYGVFIQAGGSSAGRYSLQIRNASGTDVLKVLPSGRTLINNPTDDAANALQVSGSARITNNLTLGNGLSERIISASSYIELYNGSTGDMTFFGGFATGAIKFCTANSATPKVTISYTGATTFTSSITASGTMSLDSDGTYGGGYKMLSFTGTTNGSHRIFAGTSDDMFFAAATSRGFEFRPNGGTGASTALRIDSTGVTTINNLAGTGTRMVVADASGVLSTQAVPTGTVTGSGTANKIPKWTTTTGLGDSIITNASTFIDVISTGAALGTDSIYFIGRFIQDTTTYRGVAIGYQSTAQRGIIYAESAGATSSLGIATYDGATSIWAQRMFVATYGISIIGTSTGLATFTIQNSNSLTGLYATDGGATTKDFLLSTGGSAGASSFQMFANGNTQIGPNNLANQGYKLYVDGTGYYASDVDFRSNGTSLWWGGSSARYGQLNWNTNEAIIAATSGNQLTFRTNGVSAAENRLVISTTGAATFSNLAGTGSRIVVADASGTLSASSALSGYISGTGTTNYLPKFTGASTIGNSLVYDNGSNIIINATGTIGFGAVKLLVKQSSNADYEGIAVQSVANSDVVTIAHTGTIGRIATTYGSGGTGTFTDLAFATSGIDRLTISVSGLSTFSNLLYISRPAMTTQSDYGYQNLVINTGFGGGYTGAKIQSLLAGYDGSLYGVDIGYSYDGGGAGNVGYSLRFSTNDDLSGNPIERLRINSVGNAIFSNNIFIGNSTSYGYIYGPSGQIFGSIGGNTTWLNSGTSGLRFNNAADNTTLMFISNAGKVNINNTANTDFQLYVDGGSLSTVGTTKSVAAFRTSTNIYFDIVQGNTAAISGQTITGTTLKSSDDLAISTLGVERFRIDTGGDIRFWGSVTAVNARAVFRNDTSSLSIFSGDSGSSIKDMKWYVTDGSSQFMAMQLRTTGYLYLPKARLIGDTDIAYMDLYNPNVGNVRIVNTSASSLYGRIELYTNNILRWWITTGGQITFNGTATGLYNTLMYNDNGAFSIYATEGGGTKKEIMFSTGGSNNAPALRMFANGNNQFATNNTTDQGYTLYVGGTGYYSSSLTASSFFEISDSRLKTLIKDDYKALGIESVKAKLYYKDGRRELGYYAQDLENILPSSVSINDAGFLSLSYTQVHTAKIAIIEDEVDVLKKRVSELESKLQKYEA